MRKRSSVRNTDLAEAGQCSSDSFAAKSPSDFATMDLASQKLAAYEGRSIEGGGAVGTQRTSTSKHA
jgi:hypothetical protein